MYTHKYNSYFSIYTHDTHVTENKRYSKLYVGKLDFENKCSTVATVVQLKVSAFCIFMQRYRIPNEHHRAAKKSTKKKLNFSYTLNWNINLKLEFAERNEKRKKK